jgi:hypothetical protein
MYRVPLAEFSAALALVDQDKEVALTITDNWIVLEGKASSHGRVRALLEMFKFRRFNDSGKGMPHYTISIMRNRFSDLPDLPDRFDGAPDWR